METLTRYGPKGLQQTIAASFILHALVIAVGLLLLNSTPDKIFFSPVYTVNLVETARGGARGAAKGSGRGAPLKGPKTGTLKGSAKIKTVKGPVKAKGVKAPAKKTTMKKGVTAIAQANTVSPVSIEAALKRVAEKGRRTEESTMVASQIEGLRQKTEAESLEVQRGIEDLRKAIGEAALHGAGGPEAALHGTGGPLGSPTSEGGTATSEGGGLNAHRSALTASNIDVEFPEYMVALRDQVQDNWSYPEAYRRTDLQMIVSLKISRAGKLISVWVERSSGNARFDDSLINAIKKAAPFKPLPESFEGALLETGLRFCPECGD